MTATAEVKLPDGRVAVVTGPSREAVLARIDELRATPRNSEVSIMGRDYLAAVPTIASSAIAEPISGLAGIAGAVSGLVPGGETGAEKGSRFIAATRDALSIDPLTPGAGRAVEQVGQLAEAATKAVRAPVAGLVGLGSLLQGADIAANRTRRLINEGIGPVAGEAVFEVTGSPALGAAVETIPTALLTLLGLKGAERLSKPKLEGLKRGVAERLKRHGIDPGDTSGANVERMKSALADDVAAQAERTSAFEELGLNPTRAQLTRSADDFQRQQEIGKKTGPVRSALEQQEAKLAQTFDDAIDNTAGRPVTSGSTVADEIVGRATRLDRRINELYADARAAAGTGEVVNLERLLGQIDDVLPSDRAMKGLPGSIRGNLKVRGVIDNKGNVTRRVSVSEAEDIRKFINDHFDSTSGQGRRAIRELKDALDDDVFRAAGDDVFAQARKAKADFESELSAARVSKFDRNNKNLVRDILENKIDPDQLVDKVVFSKTTRASDLRQLRDYLQQSDDGIRAFDDLRAQALDRIKERAFIGPEDAQGVRALSRDKLQRSIDRIGQERLAVLFTNEERRLLNRILKVAKLREPVRGTALGKGPSAQAIESLREALSQSPLLGQLIDKILEGRDGRILLQAAPPASVRTAPPASALAVPLAVGQGDD
jgi:hypothetical protein